MYPAFIIRFRLASSYCTRTVGIWLSPSPIQCFLRMLGVVLRAQAGPAAVIGVVEAAAAVEDGRAVLDHGVVGVALLGLGRAERVGDPPVLGEDGRELEAERLAGLVEPEVEMVLADQVLLLGHLLPGLDPHEAGGVAQDLAPGRGLDRGLEREQEVGLGAGGRAGAPGDRDREVVAVRRRARRTGRSRWPGAGR